MKRASLFSLTALALLLLCADSARAEWRLITLLREPEARPAAQRVVFAGSATVKAVQGKAERLCGIDCWTAVEPGCKLQPGDLLRIGDACVVLKMDESQSFVRVTPNTILRLIPSASHIETASRESSMAAR